MKPHRPFKLVEYNPEWVEEFNKRSKDLRLIFGNEFVDVQHIGSTSIPGMAAKPQIDILVIVKDLSKVKAYYSSMAKAGYTARGTEYVGIGDEYFTEDLPNHTRLAGVHVLPQGHPEISKYLNFRDYLRLNQADRDLYTAVKRELYQKFTDDYHHYDSGKKKVIESIRERAEKWAKARK